MEKRIEIFLTKYAAILISIVIIVIIMINNTTIGDTSIVAGEIRNKENNIICFDSGFFKDYTQIMLEMSKSNNIENGLKFDVINPNGDIVDNGLLSNGVRLNKSYKGMAGEWKIILHFENNNSNAMIANGFASTSRKDNNMRVESGTASDFN